MYRNLVSFLCNTTIPSGLHGNVKVIYTEIREDPIYLYTRREKKRQIARIVSVNASRFQRKTPRSKPLSVKKKTAHETVSGG